MNTTGIQTWAEVTMASIMLALAPLLAALPKILGFIVILIIGWIVASLVAKGIAALLRAVRFNDLAERSGFANFVRNMGMNTDAAGVLALTAKWFIRLITLVVAFDALGLQAVSDVLRQLLLWIPNLVVGIVVLVIGGLVANAFGNLVRGAAAQAGFDNPELLSKVARVGVWAFAIVVAVNQIGIAQTLVNSLFMAIVGAVALAIGLSFGLGGRDTAAEIVRGWYQQGQANAGQIERAADAASAMANRAMPEARPGGIRRSSSQI